MCRYDEVILLPSSNHIYTITGVSRHILHVLCAEIGTDLSHFPDAAHLASWAGMCPGQRESAGKRQSGRIRPGNKYVKPALVQAAHATLQTKTYLGEQYRRLKQRREANARLLRSDIVSW